MQFVKLAFVVSSCLVIRSAAAEPAPPIAPAQPAQPIAPAQPAQPAQPMQPTDAHKPLDLIEPPQSVLPNVLSTSTGTILDARLDGSRIGNLGANLLALDLRVQDISRSGIGGYLSLSIAHARSDDDGETALGNPEFGVLGVLRRGHVHLYVRGGLAVGVSDIRPLPLLATFGPRPADAIAVGIGGSTLRTGGGLRVTKGPLVIGGSGGLDIPFLEHQLGGVLSLSGSIGIARPGFGLAVGATLLQLIDSPGSDERLVGLQAIADASVGGGVRIYGAIGATIIGEGDLDARSIGVGLRVGL